MELSVPLMGPLTGTAAVVSRASDGDDDLSLPSPPYPVLLLALAGCLPSIFLQEVHLPRRAGGFSSREKEIDRERKKEKDLPTALKHCLLTCNGGTRAAPGYPQGSLGQQSDTSAVATAPACLFMNESQWLRWRGWRAPRAEGDGDRGKRTEAIDGLGFLGCTQQPLLLATTFSRDYGLTGGPLLAPQPRPQKNLPRTSTLASNCSADFDWRGHTTRGGKHRANTGRQAAGLAPKEAAGSMLPHQLAEFAVRSACFGLACVALACPAFLSIFRPTRRNYDDG